MTILYLGYCSTSDLLDRSWVGAVGVPWMGDRPWWVEVAGAIAGVLLAVLLHVTVGLAVIGATYLALEWLARRSSLLAWTLAAVVVGGALVTFALVTL